MPIRSVNVLSQMQECIKDQRYGRCRSRSKLPLQLQFWCSEGTCDLQICMVHIVISCCTKSFCTSNAFLYGTNPPASTRHPGQHRLLSSSCLSLFPPEWFVVFFATCRWRDPRGPHYSHCFLPSLMRSASEVFVYPPTGAARKYRAAWTVARLVAPRDSTTSVTPLPRCASREGANKIWKFD